MDQMGKLWMRIGVSVQVTAEEADCLLNADSTAEQRKNTMQAILAEGRAMLEGDSYIPSAVVDEFNELSGTTYDSGDVGIECPSSTLAVGGMQFG